MLNTLRRGALALAAVALIASPVAASPEPSGAVTVNKDHEGRKPTIASDAKGGVHVAYEAYEPGKAK